MILNRYQRIALLALSCVALFALPSARAATANWNGLQSNSWFDPANWWDGFPSATVNAAIDNSGDASVPFNAGTPGYAADLNVGVIHTGTLRIVSGGDIIATTAYIGNVSGANGTIIVNGGGSTLTLNGNIAVGQGGTGALNINDGGTVTNTYGKVGVALGSSGTVSVSGEGSKWTSLNDTIVGESGTGTLNASGGATVTSHQGFLGYNGAGNGTATVSGSGTTWTITSYLFVGYFGTARLDITAGGKVGPASSTTGSASAFIGHLGGSHGDVYVSGIGSTWQVWNDLSIGEQGTGTLSISNQGTVSNAYGTIGNYASGTGTVTINGAGSTWTNANDLNVGKSGTGTLTVQEGGAVSSASGYLGYTATGEGSVTIDGDGSSWQNSGNLHVGAAGKGTLQVLSGGLVTNVNATVGQSNGTLVSTAIVNGVGSTWTSTGSLTIGDAGLGAMWVQESGLVESASGYIGYDAAGTGEAGVSGDGTRWENAGNLYVGYGGTGTLHVSLGGVVTSANGIVGYDNGALIGTVNVNGIGSTWSNSGNLTVGRAGTGAVNVSGGGAVNNEDASVGAQAGGEGTVTVLGTGSAWTTRGTLYVGSVGKGTVNVTTGGQVTADAAEIGGTGTGEVNIADSGSLWQIMAEAVIGSTDSAKVNVTQGGQATANAATLGRVALSSGEVNVTGEDSRWEITTATVIGEAGTGVLNLSLGGQAATATATLGAAAGGSGTVNVGNDGTAWTVSGALTIGGAGAGALGMTGGSVSSGSAVLGSAEEASGTATIFSGTWTNAGALTVGEAGSGVLNLTGDGVLRVGASGAGTVVLAQLAGSTGVLNLGEGDTVGTLQAAVVRGGAGDATVNFNHAGTVVFDPVLEGSLKVAKGGLGRLVFDHGNTYSGGTEVNDGTLKVSNTSGSATGSGRVTVGALGTLIGDGSISGEVVVNGVIAPGDGSVAKLATGGQSWGNDGVYEWDIQHLDELAGTGWDLLEIDGDLEITSTLENPFTIAVQSLTLDGEAGPLFGFSEFQDYVWTLVTVTGQIAAWEVGQLVLDMAGFDAGSFVGEFSLEVSGKDLNLVYTVPEPSTWALLGLGAGALALLARKRRTA